MQHVLVSLHRISVQGICRWHREAFAGKLRPFEWVWLRLAPCRIKHRRPHRPAFQIVGFDGGDDSQLAQVTAVNDTALHIWNAPRHIECLTPQKEQLLLEIHPQLPDSMPTALFRLTTTVCADSFRCLQWEDRTERKGETLEVWAEQVHSCFVLALHGCPLPRRPSNEAREQALSRVWQHVQDAHGLGQGPQRSARGQGTVALLARLLPGLARQLHIGCHRQPGVVDIISQPTVPALRYFHTVHWRHNL
mmetsp:Transcript_31636/g.56215  ORF Transcript_31636/g.56215 Transcript_31636/m.56215 type:complete len:249 (-) Transcript_31636:725-1471(-)